MRETGGVIRTSRTRPNLVGVDDHAQIFYPISIIMPLQVGYDKTLFDHLSRNHNYNHNDVKKFINDIIHLSRPFFNITSSNLPVITWKLDKEILTYLDLQISADEMCPPIQNEEKMAKVTSNRMGNDKPLIIFTEDLHGDGEQTTGCAFDWSACDLTDGKNWGVVDMTWRSNSLSRHMQQMARTLAHELGHMVRKIISKHPLLVHVILRLIRI